MSGVVGGFHMKTQLCIKYTLNMNFTADCIGGIMILFDFVTILANLT